MEESNEEKKPWVVRNAWIIAITLAIFLIRMIREFS